MQGASDRPDAKAGGTLASHTADLGTLVRALPRPPVMVAHSFGGLVLQRWGPMHCLYSLAGVGEFERAVSMRHSVGGALIK